MHGRRLAALIAVSLLAACASENAAPTPEAEPSTFSSQDTASVPTTERTTVDVPVPTTRTEPSSTEPSSTARPTPSTTPEPTTSTEPTRGLLDPWPASAIDRETVGPGWVLFTYAVPDVLDDPAAEYEVTLHDAEPNRLVSIAWAWRHATPPHLRSRSNRSRVQSHHPPARFTGSLTLGHAPNVDPRDPSRRRSRRSRTVPAAVRRDDADSTRRRSDGAGLAPGQTVAVARSAAIQRSSSGPDSKLVISA